MKYAALGLALLVACSSKKAVPPATVAPVNNPVPLAAPDVTADVAVALPKAQGQGGASGLEAFPPQPPLDAATKALIPEAGIMFASRTMRDSNDTFLLYQLTPLGLREVFHQANTQVRAMGWLDRHTLVLYSEKADTGDATVQRIVDGKPSAELVIPLATWKIPASEGVGTLHLYGNGEIWLQRCVRRVAPNDYNADCLALAALRIDQPPPFVVATTLLATGELANRVVDIQQSWFHFDTSKIPTVPAPPAHTLALFTVKGAKRQNLMASYDKGWRCTRPARPAADNDQLNDAATFEWPYGSDWIERGNIPTFRPQRVRWVTAMPPRYLVEGTATNMVGETMALQALFHACATEPVAAAAYLGHNVWAEMTEVLPSGGATSDGPAQVIHGEWNLFLGTTKIATAFGGNIIAVQPTP